MKFIQAVSVNSIAQDLSNSIMSQLENKKKVLWLMGGGSGIKIAVETANLLKQSDYLQNLTFSLTDERYGPISHSNSNWLQLKQSGLALDRASLIRILNGKNIEETTKDYADLLENELNKADYKIGLFGMGTDGHTAGILPMSSAVKSQSLAAHYKAPDFHRITMTFKAIERLDEALLYVMGESKRIALDKLEEDIPLSEQPAQILKKVPKFTIYNDYKGEKI